MAEDGDFIQGKMLETKEPILGGGFWIRRVDYSPAVMQGKKKAQPYTPTDNKENTPRGWRRTVALRHRRPGRTPLPEWYPRTPLRDITSILKAYERRRLRIQATQTAAVPLAAGDPLAPLNPPPHQAASAASTTSAKPEKEACPPIKATPQAVELPSTPAPPAGRFEEASMN
ncbi:hypothetical protein HPP92_015769 [Vanilla planifolia]|uniref:Uncharacterized protein n=1 Tax=Vanilla planifolia TaxID=51239 RepID=A0A835QS83_VANPL|nr:hypothetical protein HPP92_015769 [Vanilla planifolia]